jgi:hypothetical protein
MKTSYETDVVAWAHEQAKLLRSGQLSALDIEHIAEEIEDVGKSEQRELANRMAVLLAHLLKWQHQPAMRSRSWETTMKYQRAAIVKRLKRTPSLKPMLTDPEWVEDMWGDAVEQAAKETGLDTFQESCPWNIEQATSEGWLPPDLH